MPANNVIKMRRGTAAQWTSANPVLASGEMGFETDSRKFKFGDGTATWNLTPYSVAGGLEGGGFFVADTAPVGANIGDIWYCSSDTGNEAGRSLIYYDGYWVELNPGVLGPKGNTGDPGPSTNFVIGTVSTLPAGSLATVSITGTAPNLTIDFGLPEGADGTNGADGTDGAAGDPAFHPFLVGF